MSRRILYQIERDGFELTVTLPGQKSDIVVTIEESCNAETLDLQTREARKLLDALRTALGEDE